MPKRIGRNAACPCGGGLKFKNCCAKRAPPLIGRFTPEHLWTDPRSRRLVEAMRQPVRTHGQLVPSAEFQGYRFRAVGSRLYWRPPQETFHVFLLNLLKWTLGEAWHREQLRFPFDQRHQIHKWCEVTDEHWRSVVSNPRYRVGEMWEAEPTGDVQSLVTLAYDVFHLLHRRCLPNELLERLKIYSEFQGARYEIAVAATFVRAGYQIKFISDKARKHCEFIARDAGTSAEIAVEAKSRHRPGVLHEPGQVDELRALRGDVEGLINRALEKDPQDCAFMVFIDLNTPHVPGIPVQDRAWFYDVWDSMRSLPKPTTEHPDEFNAIFLTNFSYHWDGARRVSGSEYVSLLSLHPRHSLPEELVGRLVAAVDAYGSIPPDL